MDLIDNKVTTIRSYAKRLKLSWLSLNATEMLLRAQKESPSYDDFLNDFLAQEVAGREERQRQKRLKEARLPMNHDLGIYDHSMSNGLSATQLNQLRELHWVEEGFNLMLAGPCGVGKTYIAAGLCSDVIDDLMNIVVDHEEGNLLFAFINNTYESLSFIITTNRSPAEWAQSLNDEVLATALLDRLLYKCELIQLSGGSYNTYLC